MTRILAPDGTELTEEMIRTIIERRRQRREISARLEAEYKTEMDLWCEFMTQMIHLAELINRRKKQ